MALLKLILLIQLCNILHLAALIISATCLHLPIAEIWFGRSRRVYRRRIRGIRFCLCSLPFGGGIRISKRATEFSLLKRIMCELSTCLIFLLVGISYLGVHEAWHLFARAWIAFFELAHFLKYGEAVIRHTLNSLRNEDFLHSFAEASMVTAAFKFLPSPLSTVGKILSHLVSRSVSQDERDFSNRLFQNLFFTIVFISLIMCLMWIISIMIFLIHQPLS